MEDWSPRIKRMAILIGRACLAVMSLAFLGGLLYRPLLIIAIWMLTGLIPAAAVLLGNDQWWEWDP